MRVSKPWTQVLEAVSGGIGSLRDRDFSVTIVPRGGRELTRLVSAYNSLGDVLRRERLDIYQRELLLDTVLQTTPLALILTNTGGRIVYGNIAARQLLRGGRKLEGLALEALLEESPAALREALRGSGDTLFTMEIGGEAEVYHLSRRGFVLNGQPHELVLLKQLTRELAAQEVIVWKKVIRVIAHELNNSLAPIRSLAHSGSLLAVGAESANLERVFATIGERASHLATFIEGYAKFAKLPKPRPAPVAWPAFLARIAAAQPFRIEGPLPHREATFDVGQLEQVMINLLKNAAESGSAPEAVTVSVHPRAQGLVIEVADRGAGLSEQVLRDALLPFFSTKPSGTGLGLTLCREIVEAHSGRLTLANRPGGGAVVSLHLP
jgi:nitrogen fixation/metabolism regulation signal transduction histidine kinase